MKTSGYRIDGADAFARLHGADRLGRCQAAGCDRVHADVQRGPRRRYCSRACQNRSSVAAFRARRAF
jgi:predicted RNA-binding Zn ribbon-like protein